MSEHTVISKKPSARGVRTRPDRLSYTTDSLSLGRVLVGASPDSNPRYLGPFRLAGMARQILVDKDLIEQTFGAKKGGGMSNKTRHKKHAKRGRPASSSDVRLTPHFRNPVDIERLGKALVAIALKTEIEKENNKECDNGMEV